MSTVFSYFPLKKFSHFMVSNQKTNPEKNKLDKEYLEQANKVDQSTYMT